jgi:hypothetical protein
LLSGSRQQAVQKATQKLSSSLSCFSGEPPNFGLSQPILMLKIG